MATPELAARLRAAFAYADMDKAQRAEVLGVSPRQVTRLLTGEVPLDPYKLPAVAQATGVPESFFEEGWPDESPSTPERLERVEHLYATLNGRLEQEAERRRETLTELSSDIRKLEQALAASTRPGRRQRGTEGRG
jgi:transcriptional regulator with XRE-family HTH domain